MEQVTINLKHYDKLYKANRDLQSLIKELESKADLKVEYYISYNNNEYCTVQTITLIKDAELKIAYTTLKQLKTDNKQLKSVLESESDKFNMLQAKYDDLKIAYDKYVNLYDENQQVIKDLQKIISSAGIVKVNLLFKILHYLHLI